MKKVIPLLLFAIVMMASFVGCANNNMTGALNATAESENAAAKMGNNVENSDESKSNEDSGQADATANVMSTEFTLLDDDEPVFNEFIDMLWVNPESYVDNYVTVNGQYMGYFADYLDRYVHYIFQMDEMGCCPMTMEFMINSSLSLENFPEDFTEIQITGVYSSYEDEEYNWTYYFVDADALTILEGGES